MRTLSPALAIAALVSGCSGEVTRTAAEPSETPTVAPTTQAPTPTEAPTSPPTSAAPTTVPTTTAPARRKAADGDVDGDGQPDVVRTTSTVLTVTLSASGRKVTAPVHADTPPEVLGSTDVDRDGFAEVFVKTTQGASASFATPYRYDGTTLRELLLDGQPARLGFGGSVQHGDGFRCTDAGQVEVRKAEADDTGSTYAVELTVYRLSATSLVRVRTSTSTAEQGSPEVEASYTVDCGPVGEGG